jgi:hypothetical protein
VESKGKIRDILSSVLSSGDHVVGGAMNIIKQAVGVGGNNQDAAGFKGAINVNTAQGAKREL